jgi:flagellar operon protein
MKIDEVGKTSIIQTGEISRQNQPASKQTGNGNFKQVFNEAVAGSSNLKFSQHALDRLSRRGVDIDGQTVSRLDNAVTAAGKKGAGQSLVLLDEMAFLVSVKNRTIITAMETSKMKEGVFTKIDSAVIG